LVVTRSERCIWNAVRTAKRREKREGWEKREKKSRKSAKSQDFAQTK
jgi:hypothetical protein